MKVTETNTGYTTARKSRSMPAKAVELLQDRAENMPIWIRSPKFGTERYTGFSRAKLYALAATGEIRSVSIRQPGQIKGTRLFHLQSILDFISKCEQAANAPVGEAIFQKPEGA